MTAIERLCDLHDTLVEAVWSPDDVAAFMEDVAAVEALYQAAKALLDDQGWALDDGCDCPSCALAGAVRRVEAAQ